MWLGGGHPQPLSWALLLQRQEGPPEPHQAQRSPQSLGRLALHCCGVHSQDGRTPGWDGGRILEELFPLACRPASSGLHPEDPGRAALAPSLGFPMCRIVPRGQPGPRGRCRRCGPLRPEAPAGQASPQEAGPYILRAHAGHTRPCTRTSTAHAVCISPHGELLIPPLRKVAEASAGRSPAVSALSLPTGWVLAQGLGGRGPLPPPAGPQGQGHVTDKWGN